MSDLVEKIVKRDDIRAKTPEPLNEKIAYVIGLSLAIYLRRKTEAKEIVVGHDMRLSSPKLANALRSGVSSFKTDSLKRIIDPKLIGQDCCLRSWNLGQCSTEMISYVAGEKRVPAVMVTASHNPKEYNGFKIFLPGAIPIGHQALREIVWQVEKFLKTENVSGPETTLYQVNISVDEGYVKRLLTVSGVSQEGYGKRISVVIDAGNGMGGRVFQKVAKELSWLKPIYYHEIPDGNIPSGIMPDTLDPRYLEWLADEVTKEKALLGICFDGDADRAAFTYQTAEGEVSHLIPSRVGGLIIKKFLEGENKDRKILYTLPCSAFIPELIKKLGGIPVMCPVGYGQVRERMLKQENSDCSFALEHSGHYFYRDFYCADSGMITALVVLDLVGYLAANGENLSSIILPWQSRFFQSDEINFDFPEPDLMQEKIAHFRNELKVQPIEEYSPGDPIDIKTILKEERPLESYPGRFWFCLRPSGNEPKLRLIAEVILDESIAESQRFELGPKILTQKIDQLINLVGSHYLVEK